MNAVDYSGYLGGSYHGTVQQFEPVKPPANLVKSRYTPRNNAVNQASTVVKFKMPKERTHI